MSTPVALVQVAAQPCGPAITDIPERFPLLVRQHSVPASLELALMGAEDIGHLGPMWLHG